VTGSAQRRERSILTFFATSIASRGIGIACQLVLVPIALRHLGSEAFGLWVTLNSLNFVLAYSDFGIGLGVQNQVAEALGQNDQKRARSIFVTALIALTGVTAVLLAGLLPFCLLADCAKLLHISDPALAAAAAPAILVVTLVWCFNAPLGLGQRLAYGAQLGWMHNASVTLTQVWTLLAVAAGAWLKTSITAFFILTFSGSALINLVFLGFLLRRLGWLRLRWDEFHRPYLRELSTLGIFFFLQQIATIVLFTAPPLILSATMGPAAVTPFNLVQRVLNLFSVVTNAALIPIWPAYAEARAQSDWPWIRRTLHRSLVMVLGMAVIPMFLVGPFVQQIITWWTGKAAEPPATSLVWLLVIWNALTILQQPFGYLLAGISKVRRATVFSVLTTITALGAIFFLMPGQGANALPMGLIIGFVPFIFCGNVIETFVILRDASRRPAAGVPEVSPPIDDVAARANQPSAG
jgi:O-antigen/teichoic acid export membrane protein